MSGPVNPNSKQMPDWLRKKLQTSTQANTIFMNWITQREFVEDVMNHKDPKASADAMVKVAFLVAESFDNHLENYLQEPVIHTPTAKRPPLIGLDQ